MSTTTLLLYRFKLVILDNIFSFFMTFLFLVSFSFIVSAQQDSANKFYNSLISGIDKVKGTVQVFTTAGRYRTSYLGNTVIWNFNSDTKITTNFNYSSGVMQSDESSGKFIIEFVPPINAYIPNTISIKVKKVTYSLDGTVENAEVSCDNPSNPALCTPSGVDTVEQHLEIKRQPKDLLGGHLFKALDTAEPCNGTATNMCPGANGQRKPVITRVRLLKVDNENPGLFATFKPNTIIRFSEQNTSGTTFNNFIELRTPSYIRFGDVDYQVLTKTINGELVSGELNIKDGSIKSRDINLALKDGSFITLNNVVFERDDQGRTRVNNEFGSLEANIGLGSSLHLTRNQNTGNMVFGTGSGATLRNVNLQIDEQRSTTVSVGNGSEIRLNVDDGRIPFGERSFVQMHNGTVIANLTTGKWESGKKPDVAGSFTKLEIFLGGGEVIANPSTTLKVNGGQIKAYDLNFNSEDPLFIRGEFKTVKFVVNEGSTIGIPNGIKVLTKGVGEFVADDAASPMNLLPGQKFPVGRFIMTVPFLTFTNSSTPTVILSNGKIILPLEHKPDGSITNIPNQFITLDEANATVKNDDISVSAKVSLTEGTLTMPANQTPNMEAKWSAIVEPGLSMSLTTPSRRPQNNEGKTEFKVKFNVKTLNPIRIPATTKIIFNGNAVRMDEVTQDINYQVEIPAGGGEHQDGEDPDSVETNNSNMQEVASKSEGTCPACCRWHFYLKPGTYTFNAKLGINIDSNGLHLAIRENKTNDEVHWDKQGCDIAAAALCTLILGPTTCVGGILVGNALVNNRIDTLINEKLRQDRNWSFQARNVSTSVPIYDSFAKKH